MSLPQTDTNAPHTPGFEGARPGNGRARRSRPAPARRSGSEGSNARLRFLGAFVREPLTVGSLWPSSAALSRKVLDSCDFTPGDTVVELGPGTGAFTKLILDRLRGHGRFLAIEINKTNVSVLRHRFAGLEIIHDSAEHLPRYLGRRKANCVISGRPGATCCRVRKIGCWRPY
jgi:phospholipid N-methyltransferase